MNVDTNSPSSTSSPAESSPSDHETQASSAEVPVTTVVLQQTTQQSQSESIQQNHPRVPEESINSIPQTN